MTADRFLPLAALVVLAACDQAAPPPQPIAPASAPVSALRNASEFASCKWGAVKGERFTIDAFACGPEFGRLRLEADDALPGFALVQDGPDGPIRTPVIQLFDKPAATPLDAVLPALRKASGPDAAACAFEPAPGVDHQGKPHFVLTPVGPAKAAWEKTVASDEPVELPCGRWGVGIAGDRYVFEAPGRPEIVVAADMGSEIQPFDPTTLRPSTP